MIQKSVGQNAVNNRNDVLLVQCGLCVFRARSGQPWIAIDGIVGPETIGSITAFQRQQMLPVDGRMDANGTSIKHLSRAIGGEVMVYAPVACQILDALKSVDLLASSAPQEARPSYQRLASRLRVISRYSSLTEGLRAPPGLLRTDLTARPLVIDFTGVEEGATIMAMALLAFLVLSILVLLSQSPAFRHAVDVRARELDRVMGELKLHMDVSFHEQLGLIESITDATISNAARCRKSPSFIQSPDCVKAMERFNRVLQRIDRQFKEVAQDIFLFTQGTGRGHVHLGSLRVEIERQLKRLRQNVMDLQAETADMKQKCRCPEI